MFTVIAERREILILLLRRSFTFTMIAKKYLYIARYTLRILNLKNSTEKTFN